MTPIPKKNPYRRKLSSLTFKILGVNLGAIFMLAFGFLYTAQYESELIQSELNALSKEAQLIAAAISEGGMRERLDESSYLAKDLARLMVRKISTETDFRILLFNKSGLLIADSHQLTGAGGIVEMSELEPPDHMLSWLQHFEKSVSGPLSFLPTRLELPRFPDININSIQSFPYMIDTLQGLPQAHAWHADNSAIKLTVSQPVARLKRVLGAVMLIRSGDRIDSAIQSVQFNVFRVFLATLAITIFLSLYLSAVIASPIRMLSRAAEKVKFRFGQNVDIPDMSERNDEIGDLSVALRHMTQALNERLKAIESFAADVAHELKNPLASIKSAVETLPKVSDPEKQTRLIKIINDDIRRLDRLISDISAASRLDAELGRISPQPLNLKAFLKTLIENYQNRDLDKNFQFECSAEQSEEIIIRGDEGRLAQVFTNILDNALSFADTNSTIIISLYAENSIVGISITNQGPLIPESKLETIFQRFYTERPDTESFGSHSGLGLNISQQIIHAHNGTIAAENLPAGPQHLRNRVRFVITLPKETS